MVKKQEIETIEVAGRELTISNPNKLLFPEPKHTKIDLARYYMSVAEGALRGAGGRPNMLVRYPDGITGEHFYQKRAPRTRPPWIEVANCVSLRAVLQRRSCRVTPRRSHGSRNLACLELHPHPVRADDLEHPDELRVDLDPVPGITWKQIQEVTPWSAPYFDDFNLVGWPKTSGSRGMHICVRIERRWDLTKCAARARARARSRKACTEARHQQVVEGGAPWRVRRLQPERQGSHRRIGLLRAAHARRARLDTVDLGEVDDCNPGRLYAGLYASAIQEAGRLHAAIDQHSGSLEGCSISLSARDLGDAPWPPHYRRQDIGACAGPAIQAQIARCRDRTRAPSGVTLWRAWSAGKRATGKLLPHLEPADVLVDAMRGRYSTWTRIRVNLAARTREAAAFSGAARSRREDPLELVGLNDLELVVTAVLRALIGAPAQENAAWRKRSPCMWSYFTSHTRSILSGSHDRSLPALQRLCAPGMRLDSAAAPAHPRQG